MKIVFDTCILMYALNKSDKFHQNSVDAMDVCDQNNLTKYITYNTYREFENGWISGDYSKERINFEKELISNFRLLPFFGGDEGFGRHDGTFGATQSKFGSSNKMIVNEITSTLQGKEKTRDRSILLNAILNKCKYVITENIKDFDRLREVANKHGVIISNLKSFINRNFSSI